MDHSTLPPLQARRSVRAGLGLAAVVLAAAAVAPGPAHAWLGALSKLGSAAGKGAATAGKGAAAGAGAVGGVEAVQGANAAAKAGKGAAAAEGAAAASADDISRASGLGKAVPDEVAAMLSTPGKTLLDVPDPGARSWLGRPASKLHPTDADLMVRDYAALLEGKPAAGPRPAIERTAAAPREPQLPTSRPPSQVPWYAFELVARAAHLGHTGARAEKERLCRSTAARPAWGDACTSSYRPPLKS